MMIISLCSQLTLKNNGPATSKNSAKGIGLRAVKRGQDKTG